MEEFVVKKDETISKIESPKTIIISLEEYKELLVIKGKYEELKSKENQISIASVWQNNSYETTTVPLNETKITCEVKEE